MIGYAASLVPSIDSPRVYCPDVCAGSVVGIPCVLFLVLCARGYHGGLQVLAHCEVSGLVRRKER
jgi:hypothetical protein